MYVFISLHIGFLKVHTCSLLSLFSRMTYVLIIFSYILSKRVDSLHYVLSEITCLFLSICYFWPYVFITLLMLFPCLGVHYFSCFPRTYMFIALPIFFLNVSFHYSPRVLSQPTCSLHSLLFLNLCFHDSPHLLSECTCSLLSLCFF